MAADPGISWAPSASCMLGDASASGRGHSRRWRRNRRTSILGEAAIGRRTGRFAIHRFSIKGHGPGRAQEMLGRDVDRRACWPVQRVLANSLRSGAAFSTSKRFAGTGEARLGSSPRR